MSQCEDQISVSTRTPSHQIVTGIYEWRLQHPNATLTEIEAALDQRWHRVRAWNLQLDPAPSLRVFHILRYAKPQRVPIKGHGSILILDWQVRVLNMCEHHSS